jgi:hypothetical protein
MASPTVNYLETLSYPLNATNLTKAQCDTIMAPLLNYALPAMGVCRNFPRALVCSSTTYPGLGVKHIHTLQEIARIKDILHHTYIKSTTGLLYRTLLEYLILEVGLGTNFMNIDFTKYHRLATNCLLKNTWEFIYTHQITIDHDIVVPHNTTNDKLLMKKFCKLNPSIDRLLALNQCRLFLQAYHISDLTTASGQQLSYHAWEGTTRFQGRSNKFNWPTSCFDDFGIVHYVIVVEESAFFSPVSMPDYPELAIPFCVCARKIISA